jgi:hypothetical protein
MCSDYPHHLKRSTANVAAAKTAVTLVRRTNAAALASAPQQARLYVTLFQRAATSKTEPGLGSP